MNAHKCGKYWEVITIFSDPEAAPVSPCHEWCGDLDHCPEIPNSVAGPAATKLTADELLKLDGGQLDSRAKRLLWTFVAVVVVSAIVAFLIGFGVGLKR